MYTLHFLPTPDTYYPVKSYAAFRLTVIVPVW